MSEIPRIIGNWWLGQNLGSGYSGSIFQAQHIHTGQVVALKVQNLNHECPTNRYERHIYPSLQGGKGMPTLWAAGVQGEWDYLAIDLLGASLDNLYKKDGGPTQTMDLGSVCTIAMQVIARLELMHTRGILHRDIQLGNAVVGLPPHNTTLYMIDFGFSKRYIDPYTHRHIPDSKEKRDFIGNYWFSSIGVHCRGKVPSRRDDLEAVALMLIHLLTPRGLTWTRNGVPKTDAAHTRLKQQKRTAHPSELCRGLPAVFEEFLRYCRSLKFAEQPDYTQWIEEFRALKVEEGYGGSDAFIWPSPKPNKLVQNTPRHGRTPGIAGPDKLEGILHDLTNLNLNQPNGGRPILGDRKNVEEAVRKVRANINKDDIANKGVIDITSQSETSRRESIPEPLLAPKAYRLAKLADQVAHVTDNVALSRLVREFVEVMKCNSSRTLTKDAFAFVDALYKQLANPSVFIIPLRTSRQRSDYQKQEAKEPPHVKLGVVARLRREVEGAQSNKALAEMVADFGKVTNKSTGRTVTKDGFAFLDGLAERLMVLR